MERFVRLEIFGSDGERVWRTFNLRYVRHFDEGTCRLMLNGARESLVVCKTSMPALIEAATTDIDAMSERLSYLQARCDVLGRVVDVPLAVHEGEDRLSDVLRRLCDAVCRPWWRKLFGL